MEKGILNIQRAHLVKASEVKSSNMNYMKKGSLTFEDLVIKCHNNNPGMSIDIKATSTSTLKYISK